MNMKLELEIWITAIVVILSFFIYLVNKIVNLYEEGEKSERYKSKK